MTRSEYLAAENKTEAHQLYYGQYVTPEIAAIVKNNIGYDKIVNSKDKSFNDIPLAKWDALAQYTTAFGPVARMMKENDDYLTLSGIVCVAKAAAEQMRNLYWRAHPVTKEQTN